MRVGVVRETFPGERRVALIPEAVTALARKSIEVIVESGAGHDAGFPDEAYREKDAQIADQRADVFAQAEIIAQVRSLGVNLEAGKADLEQLRPGQVLLGLSDPLGQPEAAKRLAECKVTAFALELIPRITRAQSMDVLSSMATIAGYKAVLMAAVRLPKMFPMMMTAAGTVTPARVFVIGAGVAGLQAIASSKRLGAVVSAYDVRPAVKEQIESLGAKFVEMKLEAESAEGKGGYARQMDEEFYRKQRELMTQVVQENDVVITTAAIPGKKAPVLITEEMVKIMPPKSVIIDLAALTGGNCALTRPDETVVVHDVTIEGPTNLPATVPYHASQMFSRNMRTLLLHLMPDGELKLDLEDQITRETLVCRDGEITHVRIREALGLPTEAVQTGEGG